MNFNGAAWVALGGGLLTMLVVFQPRVLKAPAWRATVTPLASIVGSGFLVLTPILLRHYGEAAPVAMVALCVMAYAIGGAIRYNIRCYGDAPERTQLPPGVNNMERLADWALTFAYVVSVAYYLNLFGAFAVSLGQHEWQSLSRWITTAVLLFIGFFGWRRGLGFLENAEEVTVGLNMSVIAGFLMALAWFVWMALRAQGPVANPMPPLNLNHIAVTLGLLITVQGFETSRYLGDEYDADTRERTMRRAQWIATGIYLFYVILVSLGFQADHVSTRETAVIGMTRVISPLIPLMLMVGALASQFSAAVADTGGCGGMAEEVSHRRIRPSVAYLFVMAGGLVLTWTADVYQIISYASRAFALYYALQCAVAISFARSDPRVGRRRLVWYGLLLILCVATTLFGASAEG